MARIAFALLSALALAVLPACERDAPRRADTLVPESSAVGAELPVPRTEVAGATWRGQLVVAGGLTADGGASSVVHFYDAATGAWRPGPALPVPLHHTAMAVLGDRLYVVGGYTNEAGRPWRVQSGVISLGAGEQRWRQEAPLATGPRGALGLAAAGGKLVALGGEANGRALATTEVYDPGARSWRPGPVLARPREHLAAAASGDRVFAIAGRTATDGNLVAVESLSPAADAAWRPEPDLGQARGGIGADAVGGRVCVVGGEEPAGTIASVECLEGGAWRAVARLRRPRHGVAVMALGDRLHVVAGGERPGLFVSGAHEVLRP